MSKTLAAVAVSFLAFTPGCMKRKEVKRKPAEVKYAELAWNDGVFYLNGKPFTGVAKEQSKEGKLTKEYPMTDGRCDGVVHEWWDNGQMSVETHFDKGKRHGLNRYWTKEGKLMKEQVYDHDVSTSVKEWPNGR